MEKEITSEVLSIINKPVNKAIILAFEQCEKFFPKNKGKIYLSNILAYFVNEKNHEELKSKCGIVPSLNTEQLHGLLKDLNKINLVKLVEGSKGAVFAFLNKDLYKQYLEHLSENNKTSKIDVTDQHIKHVGFACKEVNKIFPANKGKIYVSNILAYFVNEKNHPTINKELNCVPHYSKQEVELIVDKMSSLKLVEKNVGKNGAIFLQFNEAKFNEYFKANEKELTEQDNFLIIFCALECNKLYPNNKGKVYASNIAAYLVNERNHETILSKFNEVPKYNLTQIEKVFDNMTVLGLCKKVLGNRGASYVILNSDKCRAFLGQLDKEYTEDDYRLTLQCIKHLSDMYPNNKGKVYVSNISAFIKMTKNVTLLKSELNYYNELNKFDIEKIVDILKEKKLIGKFEGNRGATYVLLYRKAIELYFTQKLREFTEDDYNAVVFATRQLREKYPRNKGKVYVSNIHAFFRIDTNHDLLMENLGSHPVFTKFELEAIVKYLAEQKILYRHDGERGATYVTLDDKKYEEIFGRKTFNIDDYKAIVFAVRHLREKYPRNNGKVYVSNIHAFFKIDTNHDLIMESLGCHPTFTKYELEGIVKELAEKKILYRHEGDRGATYVTLDDKKFDELVGIPQVEKETLVLKILFIMNGRAYLDTIYDTILNDEFSLISVENNTIFKDKYFKMRKGFKNVEDIDETLTSLHDKGYIFIYGNYIKLTTQAVLKFRNF